MRNINRLDDFYETLKYLHKKYIPDWRFGQFVFNFHAWMDSYKHRDIFFPEEPEMVEKLIEYFEFSFPGLKVDREEIERLKKSD